MPHASVISNHRWLYLADFESCPATTRVRPVFIPKFAQRVSRSGSTRAEGRKKPDRRTCTQARLEGWQTGFDPKSGAARTIIRGPAGPARRIRAAAPFLTRRRSCRNANAVSGLGVATAIQVPRRHATNDARVNRAGQSMLRRCRRARGWIGRRNLEAAVVATGSTRKTAARLLDITRRSRGDIERARFRLEAQVLGSAGLIAELRIC